MRDHNYTIHPPKSQPPHPSQKFIDSDKDDAKRTWRWLDGLDMSNEKKWIVDEGPGKLRIPTAWYAIEILGPQNGIEKTDDHIYMTTAHSPTGAPFLVYYCYVTCAKGHGELMSKRVGAGFWIDPIIAEKFAHRNTVRQMLPQEVLAYSITRSKPGAAQAEAFKRYA